MTRTQGQQGTPRPSSSLPRSTKVRSPAKCRTICGHQDANILEGLRPPSEANATNFRERPRVLLLLCSTCPAQKLLLAPLAAPSPLSTPQAFQCGALHCAVRATLLIPHPISLLLAPRSAETLQRSLSQHVLGFQAHVPLYLLFPLPGMPTPTSLPFKTPAQMSPPAQGLPWQPTWAVPYFPFCAPQVPALLIPYEHTYHNTLQLAVHESVYSKIPSALRERTPSPHLLPILSSQFLTLSKC